jgi:hypothetical protein
LGENSEMQYDVILSKNFFLEERESVINYCPCQIIMNNEVAVNYDPKPGAVKTEPCKLTSKDRTGNIVRISTTSKSLGLLPKSELLPGVHLAASLMGK